MFKIGVLLIKLALMVLNSESMMMLKEKSVVQIVILFVELKYSHPSFNYGL